MNKGQISAADESGAQQSFEIFLNWVKRNLASEKDLVVRRATYSVWVVEVLYPDQSSIGKIDLSLPLHLQTYQLGQYISLAKLTKKKQ